MRQRSQKDVCHVKTQSAITWCYRLGVCVCVSVCVCVCVWRAMSAHVVSDPALTSMSHHFEIIFLKPKR
jgi:hypothetical protein